MTRVFECFQSHCHILKKIHEFLCIDEFVCGQGIFATKDC
jgi:hypothetical protein